MKTICQSMAGLAASAVLALGLAESAAAYTLKFADPSDPQKVTSIEALDINGVLFDVEFFDSETTNEIYGYGNETPFFYGNIYEGYKAAMKVKETLELEGIPLQVWVSVGALRESQFWLWVEMTWVEGDGGVFSDGAIGSWWEEMSGGSWGIELWKVNGVDGDGIVEVKFTQTEVSQVTTPEPASTIAILAVAGTGLLTTRKRKK